VLRRLRRQPAFAAGVVAVLALAIGASAAIFTLVDAVLLRPLPLREPDRLVTIALVRPGNDRFPLSLPDVTDIAAETRTLHAIASAFGWSANLTGGGDAERLQGARVSANYFEVTGAGVALGRPLQREDEDRPVAVVSHGVWQRRFGGAAGTIGQRIVLNGDAYTIVGVLRPDFVSIATRDPDVVVPYSPASDPRRANRAQGFLRAVARLKPGVTMEQAAGDLEDINRRMRAAYPDSHGSDLGVRLAQLHDDVSGRAAPMLRVLLAAVLLVLVVACANVANLFLVRGLARRRELAVRAALGASRPRLIAHLLAEAAVLGAAAGALGLLVARWLVGGVLALAPSALPRVAEIGIDARVSAFTALMSIGATLLFGLAPALHISRGDLRDRLQDGDRAASDGGRRVRAWLIVAEVALSTVLLITAALLARSFQRVQAVDPGFRAEGVLTVRLSLPRARYRDTTAIDGFYNRLEPRLAALPGVRAVAAANVVPMNGYLASTTFYLDGVIVKDAPEVHYRMISPHYFRALGIPLRSGRAFTAADRAGSQPVAIVNDAFAREYLRGRDPLGVTMRLGDGEETPRQVHIVGVVGDVKHFGLEQETTIEVYVPIPQVPDPTTVWLANNMYWIVHTGGDPLAAAQSVRREVASIDPGVPASFVRTMEQWMGATLETRRFNLALVQAFALAALLLAVIGVYATAASALAARKRELGIRAALGASRRAVVGLVLRAGLAPVGLGLAAGAAGALLAARALEGLLFGVTPRDPASFASVVVVLGAAAVASCSVPARRAAKLDPLLALRAE
jgi:putative ABC transport system permease protein